MVLRRTGEPAANGQEQRDGTARPRPNLVTSVALQQLALALVLLPLEAFRNLSPQR